LKKIYLFKDIGSDSINERYPLYYSLADYIVKEGFPKWSFNQGMGQNIFPLGLDPTLFFILVLGKNKVYYTIFFAELLKIFFAGLFFYFFLKKINISKYTSVIGSILYSFSGYIILGGQWGLFSTSAVYVALLLYAFEKLYQDDNWILFPISIFLIASFQPFYLYLICLFLLIYIIFRLLETNEREVSKIFRLFVRLFLLGIIGIAMSSFFLINGLQLMLQSPRGSGESSYFSYLLSKPFWALEGTDWGKTHYLTALMRFFSSDMLGTGNYFQGWRNYLEAPLFYCGLISLVLLPHFLNFADKKKKIIYFAFILVFIVPVIFPFFRYAFWLFTGNYYRIFSLFVALSMLLIALKSMDHIDSTSNASFKITLATFLFLVFLLYYPYDNAKIIHHHIRNIVALLILTYSVLIYLLQFKRIKNYVKITLLFIIAIELIYFSGITVNKRPVMSHKETTMKVGYNDYTVNAVYFLKQKDKTFFRINKDYSSGLAMHKSDNDANAQDFYGTPSYHGFNQINYIKFLKELEIIESTYEVNTRWHRGLVHWPLLHSFASIKYALSKEKFPSLLKFGYFPVATFGNINIFQNKFTLPLGFSYEKYISLKDFKTLSQDRKILALYKAAVIDDSIDDKIKKLKKLDIKEIPSDFSLKEYARDIELLKKVSFVIIKHGQNNIQGQINTDKDKILFFSIPLDKGWNIKVDGERVNTMMVNIGFIGIPINKGVHQIELSYTPVYYYTGAYLSLISFFLFMCLIIFKQLKYRKEKLSLPDQ